MKIYTILFLTFIVFLSSCQNERSNRRTIIIENNLFTKTISCGAFSAGTIEVLLMTKGPKKVLINSKKKSYFEFVLNNEIVSSSRKLWILKNGKIREMGNGGKEYSIVFEGVKEPVEGLQIELIQQYFPNSTLMREKMILKTEGQSFQLNKKDGKLHFKFPVYSLKNSSGNTVQSTEIRMASWEKKPITFGNRQKGNHMYYPDIILREVSETGMSVRGPFSVLSNDEISWITAYEHASQDDLNGLFDKQKLGSGNLINDAMQGTKGVFNFPIEEEDFRFLEISAFSQGKSTDVSVEIKRGGYLDGEVIDQDHPYSTVWTATGFYKGNDMEVGKEMIRNYLFNQICEKQASRIPEFYYNTWGMQRQDKSKPLRGILTYERIFEEIDYAAELGVDIFVLDDGWENTQGEWFPHKERLSEGLAPIKERLDKHGIKMGLWYSPMGIDSTTQRYKAHPEWVIKDSENKPIMAQWNHPAFDFVSGFFDLFISDCKKMIDQGCRFMKWDAINTFYSSLPNLNHGSGNYPEEEIRARYEYLLPIYVVKAMEILTDYEPELVIEMDLTEARRVMVGLAPLSQGKLFWMNNGASWYNDYSTFRTQSMRTIANEFAGIIPLELFTYANYPQNEAGAMKYNINNSLLGGHGFWGNLQLMTKEQREWVGEQVQNSKIVLPYLVNVNPVVEGKVGDSPEIYKVVNKNEAVGQIILFSENPFKKDIAQQVNADKFLAVLNHPYSFNNGELNFSLDYIEKDASEALFILPNRGKGISVVNSTSSIHSLQLTDDGLNYKVAEPGTQTIIWSKQNGKPEVKDISENSYSIEEEGGNFLIRITTKMKNEEVVINMVG